MTKSNPRKSNSKRDAIRSKVKANLNKWAESLDVYELMPNPEIPGVFNQPSYLMVPSLGRLVAIYTSWIPRRRPYWPFVLAAIEDLFEVKTLSGSNTIVGLVLVNDTDERQLLYDDMMRLLESAFDFCCLYRVSTLSKEPNAAMDELSSIFYRSNVKEQYKELWDSERQLMLENLKGLNRKMAEPLMNTGDYGDWPLDKVRERIEYRLRHEAGFDVNVNRNVAVLNIKEWFFLPDFREPHYYFQFDFAIQNNRPILLHVTRGCLSRTYREELRSLAAKARLIRYRLDHQLRRLQRGREYKMWLAVTSHLRGPDFDELRYVRALVAAGWFPVRADLVNIKKLWR